MLKKIKANIYLPDLYSQIDICTRDVYFITNEGNRINLKNILSQIFFQTTFAHSKEAVQGYVYCQNQLDYELLDNFLE